MSRICKLSEKAISSYVFKLKNNQNDRFFEFNNQLRYICQRVVSEWRHQESLLLERIRSAESKLRYAQNLAAQKVSEIKSALANTPKTIKEVRYKRQTCTDANGNLKTIEVPYTVQKLNPLYAHREQLLGVASQYYNSICSANCNDLYAIVSNVGRVISSFERHVSDASAFFLTLSNKVCDNINHIVDRAKKAQKKLSRAKSAVGELSEICSDLGEIDVDGVEKYIQGINECLSDSRLEYERLYRTADSCGDGWRDCVYGHFYCKIDNDLYDKIQRVLDSLSSLSNALTEMCLYLGEYYDIDVSYERRNYSFNFYYSTVKGFKTDNYTVSVDI